MGLAVVVTIGSEGSRSVGSRRFFIVKLRPAVVLQTVKVVINIRLRGAGLVCQLF